MKDTFYKETNFKETPIGKIPKEWEVERLGMLCEFKRGFSYRSSQITSKRTQVRFLTINDIEKEGGLKREAEKLYIKENVKIEPEFFINEGDVFIANTDMTKGFIIGAPILIKNIDEKYVYSMDLTKLIFNNTKIGSGFLFYYLTYMPMRKRMKSSAQGTNVLHLNYSIISNFFIPLPPFLEQQKIAEILSTVDEAIQRTNEIITKTERLKKGLMQELLTKGIGHKEFKDTEIGRIPKEWEVINLEKGSLIIRTGPFGSQLRKSELSERGAKVYTQENILKNDFSLGNLYISYDKFEKLKIMEVKPGDVLLTIRGSTGYSAVFPERAERGIIHTNLAYIRLKRSLLLPEYLSLLINGYSHVRFQIKTLSSATTLGALYAKHIKKIKIPLPPLQEQQKIVKILLNNIKKLELERNEKVKLERIKQGLMDLLLTGKIRVKVT